MLKQVCLSILFVIVYFVVNVSLCLAQVDQYGRLQTSLSSEPLLFSEQDYSLEALEEFKHKWVSIEPEILNPENEWIGDYKAGMDTTFVGLRWSKGGYNLAYVSVCAHSSVWEMDYGNITEFSPSLLQLSSTLDPKFTKTDANRMKNDPLFSKSYIPVKWGEQHYLVPKENIADFCVQISKDFSPTQFGLYFLKQGDWEKPIYGKLILPNEYKHLLQKHIDANVIEIIGKRTIKNLEHSSHSNIYEVISTIRLNVGKKQKITKGLSFYLSSVYDEKAKVISVEDTTCQVVVTQKLELVNKDPNNCQDTEDFLVKVGNQVSTKIPDIDITTEENND